MLSGWRESTTPKPIWPAATGSLQPFRQRRDLRACVLRAAADHHERLLRRAKQRGGGFDRVLVDRRACRPVTACRRAPSAERGQTSTAHSSPTGRGRPLCI